VQISYWYSIAKLEAWSKFFLRKRQELCCSIKLGKEFYVHLAPKVPNTMVLRPKEEKDASLLVGLHTKIHSPMSLHYILSGRVCDMRPAAPFGTHFQRSSYFSPPTNST
jgi:hypothetical protein